MLSTIETTKDTAAPRPTRADASGEAIACMELDRFCEHCAYNLRTLPIFRDERTGIPIVRCTECGKFQSANDTATALRPWAHRLTSMLIGLWVLTMIFAFVWVGVGEAAIAPAPAAVANAVSAATGRRVRRLPIARERVAG